MNEFDPVDEVDETPPLGRWAKKFFSDGRVIRATIIGLVVVGFLIYLARATGVVSTSKALRQVIPTPIAIPTPPYISPDLDDTIIFPGESVTGNFESGTFKAWEFSGSEGDVVDVLGKPLDQFDRNLDLILELFGPDGQLLVKVDERRGGQPELLRGVVLPTFGEYTIWISENGHDESGAYLLTLTTNRVKETHPMRIGLNESLEADILLGDFPFWVVSADADQILNLTLVPFGEYDSQFKPFVEIFTPSGELLERFESAEPASVLIERGIQLTENGSYTVWVGEEGFDNAGHFSLAIHANQTKDEISASR